MRTGVYHFLVEMLCSVFSAVLGSFFQLFIYGVLILRKICKERLGADFNHKRRGILNDRSGMKSGYFFLMLPLQ